MEKSFNYNFQLGSHISVLQFNLCVTGCSFVTCSIKAKATGTNFGLLFYMYVFFKGLKLLRHSEF
jgi:hypothetical protein